MLTRLSTTFFSCVAALGAVWSLSAQAAEPTYAVKVTAIVEHPALDSVRKGALEELLAQGYVEGKDFSWEFQSAQGNSAIAGQIAKKFAGDKPSVIIAIGTPSAQAVAAAVRGQTPVVFSAVTDPVGAKLVKNLKKPGANITGASDVLPLENHLALMREMLPNLKTIGILFNPSEANSVAVVKEMRAISGKVGIEVLEGPAPDTNSVQSAARSLAGKVDAFYVPTDNTIVAAMEGASRISVENKIPLFASDNDSVPRGALAALGLSYQELGRETGKIAARILKGEKAGDIPVAILETNTLVLNADVAAKIGLNVPESILKRAEIVQK